MTGQNAITALVALLLGGGLATTIAQLVSARVALRRLRQDEEKLPAEVESVWLGSAERAVSVLQGTLDRAESQIGRLEKALERRDQRVEELETELVGARARLVELQGRCEALERGVSKMRDPREQPSDP